MANGKDQELGEYNLKSLPLFTTPHPSVSILISLHLLHNFDVEQHEFKNFEKYCKRLHLLTCQDIGQAKGVGKTEAQVKYLWIK